MIKRECGREGACGENTMKDHATRRFAAGLTAVTSLLCGLPAAPAVDVTGLHCEYRDNPRGIDVGQPRLSWRIEVGGQRSEVRLPSEAGKSASFAKATAGQIRVQGSGFRVQRSKAARWNRGGGTGRDGRLQRNGDGGPRRFPTGFAAQG